MKRLEDMSAELRAAVEGRLAASAEPKEDLRARAKADKRPAFETMRYIGDVCGGLGVVVGDIRGNRVSVQEFMESVIERIVSLEDSQLSRRIR